MNPSHLGSLLASVLWDLTIACVHFPSGHILSLLPSNMPCECPPKHDKDRHAQRQHGMRGRTWVCVGNQFLMSAVITNCGRVVLATSLHLLEPQHHHVKTKTRRNEIVATGGLTSDMCIFSDGKDMEKASRFLAAMEITKINECS